MTQHLFNGETPSDKANLDANFTELYTRTELLSVGPGVLGVGVTPSAWWGGRSGIQMGASGTGDASVMYSPGTANYVQISSNLFVDASVQTRYVNVGSGTFYAQGSGVHSWGAAQAGAAGALATTLATLMALDITGNLTIGSSTYTSSPNPGVTMNAGGILNIGNAAGTAGWGFSTFSRAGVQIGSITQSGTTGVAYNTSSDYRLKTAVAPIANSGAFIDALKPCTWTWISDGTAGAGFIAHELQAVSPGSVTGAKDAVDADGKPVYQAVEYGSSEVIAMLVAELQAVRARLHALDGH